MLGRVSRAMQWEPTDYGVWPENLLPVILLRLWVLVTLGSSGTVQRAQGEQLLL